MSRIMKKTLACVVAIALCVTCFGTSLFASATAPTGSFNFVVGFDEETNAPTTGTLRIVSPEGFLVSLFKFDTAGFELEKEDIEGDAVVAEITNWTAVSAEDGSPIVDDLEDYEPAAQAVYTDDDSVAVLVMPKADEAFCLYTELEVQFTIVNASTTDPISITFTDVQAADAGTVDTESVVTDDGEFLSFANVNTETGAVDMTGVVIGEDDEPIAPENIHVCTFENNKPVATDGTHHHTKCDNENCNKYSDEVECVPGDYVETTPAQVGVAGEETAPCKDGCGNTFTREIQALEETHVHKYENAVWTVTTQATYDTDGVKTCYCTEQDCPDVAGSAKTENFSAELDTNVVPDSMGTNVAESIQANVRVKGQGLGYSKLLIEAKTKSIVSGFNFGTDNVTEFDKSAGTYTGTMMFYVTGIPSYGLGLDVSLRIRCYDADGAFVAYSNAFTYSPATELTNLFNTTGVEKYKYVITDLLNMGAAVQSYFKDMYPNSDIAKESMPNINLPNQDYASDMTDLEIAALAKEAVVDAHGGSITFSPGVNFDPNPAYLLIVKQVTTAGTFDELTYNMAHGSANKKTLDHTGPLSEVKASASAIRHTFSDVAFYDLNQDITFKIFKGETEVYSYTDNVVAYMARTDVTTSKLGTAHKAIIKFAITAREKLL